MIVNRRNFLGSVVAAGAVGLVAPRIGQAAESRVEILINEPIGIGPRDKRPRRVNFWADTTYKITESYKQLNSGPQKYEPNWFGTNEFMQFCRLTGAQPYFAANVRSLKVKDFIDWIEYCNAPAGLTSFFEMYAAHQGAQAVRTEFISPRVSFTRADKPADFLGLSGSASLNDKELTLTAVNPDAKNARETEINVRGARVMEARARVLSATDIHAHNSFANPRGLEPRDEKVNVGGGGQLVYRFQPASVTRLHLTLS